MKIVIVGKWFLLIQTSLVIVKGTEISYLKICHSDLRIVWRRRQCKKQRKQRACSAFPFVKVCALTATLGRGRQPFHHRPKVSTEVDLYGQA